MSRDIMIATDIREIIKRTGVIVRQGDIRETSRQLGILGMKEIRQAFN